MKNYIVDLDNCISDDRWRRDFLGDWDEYHSRARFDMPCNTERFKESNNLIITGRPEKWRSDTVHWLENIAKIPYIGLLMRPEGDLSLASEMKIRLLKSFLAENDITFDMAFDDLPPVVNAYRKFGINAEVLKIEVAAAFYPAKKEAKID